jgi:hypothetical protein
MPLVPIVSYAGDSLPNRELASDAAELRAPATRPPQWARTPDPTAPFKPSRIDPMNREPMAKPATAPFKPSRIDPMNREPTAKPGSTAPFKPFRTDPLNREPMAKPATAPFKPSRIDPLNREPTAKPGSTVPFKPFRTDPLNREPTSKPDPAAPRVTGSSSSSAAATAPPARARDPASRPDRAGTHPRRPATPVVSCPPRGQRAGTGGVSIDAGKRWR